jgi:hypothetical protein
MLTCEVARTSDLDVAPVDKSSVQLVERRCAPLVDPTRRWRDPSSSFLLSSRELSDTEVYEP